MLTNNLILVLLFYTLGSLPFALILTKVSGYGDIRNIGSGNIGATNVLRTGNKYLAFIVLFLDVAKGFLPFVITSLFFPKMDLLSTIFLCQFAIIGHMFPIWLKFKGGKGVATYIGFLFGLSLLLGLLFIISWLIIAFISKYSSLSSLISSLLAPIYFIFIEFSYNIGFFLIYLSIIILLKHSKNIKRLINRTENKIKLYK